MTSMRAVLHRFGDLLRDAAFPPRCISCGCLLQPFDRHPAVLCPDCLEEWNAARVEAAEAAAEDAVRGHAFLVFYHPDDHENISDRIIFHLKHRGDPRAFAFVAENLLLPVRIALDAIPTDTEPEETEENELPARMQDESSNMLSDDESLRSPLKDDGHVPHVVRIALSPSNTAAQASLFTFAPRSRKAINEDGLDQAACIARALARAYGGNFAPLIVRTRRLTAEQKRLNARDRRQNATDTYILRRHAEKTIAGRTIVLCDDLSTTGSTLTACTELLLDAGARAVVWATVGQTNNDS